MDPNACLAEIRSLSAKILADMDREGGMPEPSDAARLAELNEGLDGWLSKRGFLPSAWER
ncbi:hypothetical protein SMC26_39590 [Actinomadura fulvescens]|uniref:Uncharacterized protein n=1 Tax=Actinomadura fulvescens TaxID=46160 RepID=A0ABP6CGX1_9ACTN